MDGEDEVDDADAGNSESLEELEKRHKQELRELEGRHRREAKKTMSKDAKAEFAGRCLAEETDMKVRHRLEVAAATAGPEEAARLAQEEEHAREQRDAAALAADAARQQVQRDADEAASSSATVARKLRVVADLFRIPKSIRSMFHAAAEYAANTAKTDCTLGAIDLHRPMSRKQVKALLQQYIALYALDVPPAAAHTLVSKADGAGGAVAATLLAPTSPPSAAAVGSVTVPPSDALYKIAREASVAVAASAAASAAARSALALATATTAKTAPGGPASTAAAAANAATTAEAEDSIDFPSAYEEEDEEDEGEGEGGKAAAAMGGMGGVVVAGVWVPTVGAALQEASAGGSGGGSKRTAGGSSIGGWGVDADKVWKPTQLPSRGSSSVSPTPNPNPKPSLNAPRSVSFAADSKGSKGADKAKGKGLGLVADENCEEPTAAAAAVPPAKEKPPLPTGPVTVNKDALLRCFTSKLTPAYTVTLPDGTEKIATGAPPSVDISVGVVRGNKSATAIRGLEDLIGPDEMGRIRERLAKKFAASCSIGPCDHNPKITEIMVQGNLAREARDFLVETYGVPGSCITSSIGKGVKKK